MTTSSKTPPASSTPSISSSSLATLQVRCVAASSKTPWVTAGARVIPSIKSGFFCAPHVIGSRSVNKNASVRPSWQMRRISVSKSPTFTGQVRDVFHQDTPAQGRRLAARLIESLPRCPIPEIARLGADPTQVEGRTRRLLRYRRSQQRANRSHQRNHRTGQTHRQRLPQPHQLQTPNAPHHRRPRRLHPHSTLKSRQSPSTEDIDPYPATTRPTPPTTPTPSNTKNQMHSERAQEIICSETQRFILLPLCS